MQQQKKGVSSCKYCTLLNLKCGWILHYKVTDERSCAVIRASYNVLDIDREGHKELLGMYLSRNEGANFWLSVLTDLQNRGVEHSLIALYRWFEGFS